MMDKASDIIKRVEKTTNVDADEYIVILFFLFIAIYMFIGSFSFRSDVAFFPMATSAFIILGCILIIIHQYLPTSMEALLMGSDNPFEREEFAEKDEPIENLSNTDQVTEDRPRPINDTLFSAINMASYLIIGVLIGFLWATPLYVITYCLWFKQNKTTTAGLSVLSFVIALGFAIYLNLPLDTGILTELVMDV